jgi:hypothetical protein
MDLMRGKPSSVIAGCFAMAAFAVAILAGLAGENETISILTRSLVAMFICYPLGLIVGMICERLVSEHVRSNAAAHPIRGESHGAAHSAAHSGAAAEPSLEVGEERIAA